MFKRTTSKNILILLGCLAPSICSFPVDALENKESGSKKGSNPEIKAPTKELDSEQKKVLEILDRLNELPNDNEIETMETRKDLLFLITRCRINPEYVLKRLKKSDLSKSENSCLIPWIFNYIYDQPDSGKSLDLLDSLLSNVHRSQVFKIDLNKQKLFKLAQRIAKLKCADARHKLLKYKVLKQCLIHFPGQNSEKRLLTFLTYEAAEEANRYITNNDYKNTLNTALRSFSQNTPYDSSHADILPALMNSYLQFDLKNNRKPLSWSLFRAIPFLIEHASPKVALKTLGSIYSVQEKSRFEPYQNLMFLWLYGTTLEANKDYSTALIIYKQAYAEAQKTDNTKRRNENLSSELIQLYIANLNLKKKDYGSAYSIINQTIQSSEKEKFPNSADVNMIAKATKRLILYRQRKFKDAATIESQPYGEAIERLKNFRDFTHLTDTFNLLPSEKEMLEADIAIFKKTGDSKRSEIASKKLSEIDGTKETANKNINHKRSVYNRLRSEFKTSVPGFIESVSKSAKSPAEKIEELLKYNQRLLERDLYSLSLSILDKAQAIFKADDNLSNILERRILNDRALALILNGKLVQGISFVQQAEKIEVPKKDESHMVTVFLKGKVALAKKEYKKAESLLRSIEDFDSVNNTWRNMYVRKEAPLALAYAQYEQKQYQKAKLTLITGSLKYLNRGYSTGYSDSEYNSLLALCYQHTGHAPLGKHAILESKNTRVLSPLKVAKIFTNTGKFYALEDNQVRAQRFFSLAKNVLVNADLTDPENLTGAPESKNLVSLIAPSSSIKTDKTWKKEAAEKQKSNPQWKKVAKRNLKRKAFLKKNREDIKETEKLLNSVDKKENPQQYLNYLKQLANYYGRSYNDKRDRVWREEGHLNKSIQYKKQALEFYISSAKSVKWSRPTANRSFRTLSSLKSSLSEKEFYDYLAKLLDVVESRTDSLKLDWEEDFFEALFDDARPRSGKSEAKFKPDKTKCYELWLAARKKYRGKNHKSLDDILSSLGNQTKGRSFEAAKASTLARQNLSGITVYDKFYAQVSLAQLYLRNGKVKESEQAWLKACEIVDWHFPGDGGFKYLLRMYKRKKLFKEEDKVLDALLTHPNKKILALIDPMLKEKLNHYLTSNKFDEATKLVEKRVKANDNVPGSDADCFWQIKLSYLYLATGKDERSKEIYNRILAAYKLTGRSTELLEKNRKSLLK